MKVPDLEAMIEDVVQDMNDFPEGITDIPPQILIDLYTSIALFNNTGECIIAASYVLNECTRLTTHYSWSGSPIKLFYSLAQEYQTRGYVVDNEPDSKSVIPWPLTQSRFRISGLLDVIYSLVFRAEYGRLDKVRLHEGS